MHHQPHSIESAQIHISFNRTVAEGIPLQTITEESQSRRFRPVSPVKAISNFLSGSMKDSNPPSKEGTNGLNFNTTSMLFPPNTLPATTRKHQRPTEELENNKVTLIGSNPVTSKDSINHLERSFAAYIVALRSKSGNIVGRVLRSRANADELDINELYNTLGLLSHNSYCQSDANISTVEDPSKIQAAAEASVDILFAAFEKFLNKVWIPRMGPILASDLLGKMQSILGS